jgi:hypothetical protein
MFAIRFGSLANTSVFIFRTFLHLGGYYTTKEQVEEWAGDSTHTVLILDDLMTHVSRSEESVAILSITEHHKNCMVLFLDTKSICAV